ncbi:DMT family transporter [Allorhizobium sp. BGMRC 0089]|uniref:DMT family transporter n=1 Tax=Allorhizobium sonneratiae TaxID=2934936 RepID=UPI002033FC94|nr:DMT family transporter [Allorhizobium sonneratiae]MCM2291245.1 DMT family transporter [Allorhizobium sonneratiae]
MSRFQANLMLLLAAAIWGGGFVAQSTAMAHLGANWFNAIRFGLAFASVLPFALMESRKSHKPMTRREIIGFALIGLSLFAAQTAQQFGLKTTTVTNASFLTGLYVVIVPVLSVLVLNVRPHWVVWPSALMALFGILLLNGGSLSGMAEGDLLTILCAALFSVQILMTGRMMITTPRPLTLAGIQFLICAILGTMAGAALEPISLADIHASLTQVLYGGLFSSGFAFSLQIIGQRYTSASQAAIFMSSEALFGALLGALILHETLPVIGYVGCALLFLAMLTVELVPELYKNRPVET